MPLLRITGGTLRGRRIAVPPADVRPTSERARQAFFNIAGPRLANANFLDLFAGTGAFSFEAVSRGASLAMAIDSSTRNTRAIGKLAEEWEAPVKAIAGDVFRVLPSLGEQFDVIFADPPYEFERYDDLLAAIDAAPCVGEDALVAIEHRKKTTPFSFTPHRLELLRRAEYGEVWITLWKKP